MKEEFIEYLMEEHKGKSYFERRIIKNRYERMEEFELFLLVDYLKDIKERNKL